MSVRFVVDSRQPANNKAGCMGHILQHSRVISRVLYQFCSFLMFLSYRVLLVDVFAPMCVYRTVLFCPAAIMHYGAIKRNNNNN